MSKPDGTYWTCKPSRYAHDPEELVEPWSGTYAKRCGESHGTVSAGEEWANVTDIDVYAKASDAWLAYAEWTRDRECHYADEHDRAVTRLQEARKDEADTAKLAKILNEEAP